MISIEWRISHALYTDIILDIDDMLRYYTKVLLAELIMRK